MKKILLALFLITILITTVSAQNWTPSFDTTDKAIYNQSSSIDNSGSTPWEMFLASGLIGLGLFLFSVRPRASAMELEVDAIIGTISTVPIGFCAWAAWNVDRITGSGVTSQNGIYVMMVNHTLYSFPIIGILMAVFCVIAIANVFRILAQHKLFQIKSQEEELAKNKPKFGPSPQSEEPDKPQ